MDYDDATGYYVQMSIGYNNGDSSETVIHNASEDYKLATDTWYHVGVTYDDSDKSYRIRLYDASSESVSQKTGTATNNINVEDGPATVGRYYGSAGYWDGLIDQMVVFNDILTADEIDQTREATTGSSPDWHEAVYTYDPAGRRIQRPCLVARDSSLECRHGGYRDCVHDLRQRNPVCPSASNHPSSIILHQCANRLLRKYVYGPGVDQPVCMIDVPDSNAAYYYHFDGLGSVIALSDADGHTAVVYEYDVYGRAAASDPNHPNPFLFTARRFDTETGLYYYRARYYNPYIGRFLQTDPIGYADGINWYGYCANNPSTFVDPSGLKPAPDPLYGRFEETVYVLWKDAYGVLRHYEFSPESGEWGGEKHYWCLAQIASYLKIDPNQFKKVPDKPKPAFVVQGPADGYHYDAPKRPGDVNLIWSSLPIEPCEPSEPREPSPRDRAPHVDAEGWPLVAVVGWPGWNPAHAPPGFEWRGQPGSTPGSKEGSYYNPATEEVVRPDLDHPGPIGPHWDYRAPDKKWYRIYPDGRVALKR